MPVSRRLLTTALPALALSVLLSACGGGDVAPSGGGGGGSAPVVTGFTASPASLSSGQVSTLSWTVTGATTLSISPSPGTVTGTSVVVSPAATTTYTLTATNASGSATRQVTITVLNGLEPACSGTGCGAASATQYAGSGVGIWRSVNTGSSAATIDIDVSGVSAGNQVALVFSNGSSLPTTTLPSPGTLLTPATPAPAPSLQAALVAEEREPDLLRSAEHEDLVRRGLELASHLEPATPSAGGTAMLAATPLLATPAVGDSRTWYNSVAPVGTYSAVVQATCPLPTGRNAVFWVDPNAWNVSITSANLDFFKTVFCGTAGGYAKVVAALGDVWGPAAAAYSNVIHDPTPGLLDFNIVFLQVTPATNNWAGYVDPGNVYTAATHPQSNEALAFFIDAQQVAVSSNYIASALLHEMTHMVNVYQRSIVLGVYHDTWLEEMSAMMTEDIVGANVIPGRYSSIPGQRVRTYIRSGGAISLINWETNMTSYYPGGCLDGLLDRKYGTRIWKGLIGCPADSYGCLDGLIRTAGGIGFADEFARMGATTLGLVPLATSPAGYGFPQATWDGYLLDSIDPMTYASLRPAVATTLGATFDPGMQTYQLDTVGAGATRYHRTGVRVPAGTSIMLVIK